MQIQFLFALVCWLSWWWCWGSRFVSGVTKCISGESQQSVELKMLNTVTDNQTYQNHKVLTLDNFGSKIATISHG